jgi:SNF2 family DNA or RNA helicase
MQNTFMQLKKIVNHPYLIQMPLIPGENKLLVNENIVKVSGKFQLLDAMLTKLRILGHKVLYIIKVYLNNVLLILNNALIILNTHL